jgi:hypothetical protein
MLRGIAWRDALHRIVFRLQTRFPKAAAALSRCAIVVGPRQHFRDVPSDRPIVLTLTHFGPLHFVVTVAALRLLRGRKVYIFHAGGDTGEASRLYFERIGLLPYVNGPGSLEVVDAQMAANAPCAVIVAYDYLGGRGRRSVPFLGGTLYVSTGLARIADQQRAVVIDCWWEAERLFPRFRIGEAYELDERLEREQRQAQFIERMFRVLEGRVRKAPETWTEWPNAAPAETSTTPTP